MERLTEVLKELDRRFYAPEDFPLVPRERFPASVLPRAAELSPEAIPGFAAGLSGAELEGLLLDLVFEKDPRRVAAASTILKLRCTPRLWRLLGVLCRHHYTSDGLYAAAAEIRRNTEDSALREDPFFTRFGASSDRAEAFAEAAEQQNGAIEDLCRVCGISENSFLAREGALHYLTHCGKQGLLSNIRRIADLTGELPEGRLRPLLTNVFSKLSAAEQNDGVNLAVQARLGLPENSPLWADYPAEMRERFLHWHFLHRLKLHLGSKNAKFKILGRYFEHVRAVEVTEITDAGSLFAADFGEFVITDIAGAAVSCLAKKAYYETAMDAYREEGRLPVFARPMGFDATARDFMLKKTDSPGFTLEFGGVGMFYAEEMLDLKFGGLPEFRTPRGDSEH